MLHSQRGGLPRTELQAVRLETGVIPAAMQWKKAAVFALANPEAGDFLTWLKDLPDGLEKVNSATFSDNSRPKCSLFVLFGWSTSGADELRRAAVDSVVASGRELNVYVSRPQVELNAGFMGTADMRFVGWEIPLGSWQQAGKEHKALLHLRRDTIRISATPPYKEAVLPGKGYEQVGEIDFRSSRTD